MRTCGYVYEYVCICIYVYTRTHTHALSLIRALTHPHFNFFLNLFNFSNFIRVCHCFYLFPTDAKCEFVYSCAVFSIKY